MTRSMTGFGQALSEVAGYQIQVEMKSVNHRYNEIMIRMPREWMHCEDALKKEIQQSIKRGRIDVFITVEQDPTESRRLTVNWPLVDEYHKAAAEMRQRYAIHEPVQLSDLMQLPDVFIAADEQQDHGGFVADELRRCVQEATMQVFQMRDAEGRALQMDLLSRIQVAERIRMNIARSSAEGVGVYRDKLRERIDELLLGVYELDEARLATEVALFAERTNVEEEITRLESHLIQFAQLLNSHEPVGRKLDFLTQEMNRETNTIGAKTHDLQSHHLVVELKAELEKIREQVQNIE